MEELRQASVELVGTAYHTGCGIQHLLQFVGRRFRRTCEDCVAVARVMLIHRVNLLLNGATIFVMHIVSIINLICTVVVCAP